MPINSRFPYRPEIDGLRAVAVVAVVLYHAGFGCPGGYVGVDIFFVISGFLITSIIWKDLEAGKFTLIEFWERRARRIVPALVVVTLATLIGGFALMLPEDLRKLGVAAASQVAFAANVHYYANTGYFEGGAAEKPLLHTWSLAVEEQFYAVIPILLLLVFRFRKLRGKKIVVTGLSIALLASFALSVFGVHWDSALTFFMLPTRAWELLAGSLLVFLPECRMGRGIREWMAWMGLGLVIFPIFTYSEQTAFPGLAALPPCAGAALLIWAHGRGATLVGSALKAAPVVFIGLISYSLYLWHWPLLALAKNYAILELSTTVRIALVAAGIICAVLSWKYVEAPFRTRKFGDTRRNLFMITGAGMIVMFVFGVLFWANKGFPGRFSEQAQAYAFARNDLSFINELESVDVQERMLVPMGVEGDGKPEILVWGDSHAMAAIPAIHRLLEETGKRGVGVTRSATAPVADWPPEVTTLGHEKMRDLSASVLTYLETERVPHVILSGYWKIYHSGNPDLLEAFGAVLIDTVRRVAATGSQPWVLLDVPEHIFDIPSALTRNANALDRLTAFQSRPTPENVYDGFSVKLLDAIRDAGGKILDPKPAFLDPKTGCYRIESGGTSLYRDADHLTTSGAEIVLLPFLRETMDLE